MCGSWCGIFAGELSRTDTVLLERNVAPLTRVLHRLRKKCQASFLDGPCETRWIAKDEQGAKPSRVICSTTEDGGADLESPRENSRKGYPNMLVEERQKRLRQKHFLALVSTTHNDSHWSIRGHLQVSPRQGRVWWDRSQRNYSTAVVGTEAVGTGWENNRFRESALYRFGGQQFLAATPGGKINAFGSQHCIALGGNSFWQLPADWYSQETAT